jgi:ligand-binding SRPBCC domain-containing protein
MLPAFQNHVGGPLGSGRQGMSWIHEQDLISAICFALEQESISGPVNGVAPNSVSNKVFTKTLGHVLKTFACIPAPAFVLNALLGEMAMLLLTGQHVTPKVLLDAGFQFKFPELKDALLDLCGTPHSPPHLKTSSQWLPQPVEELYPFFCDEKNLEAITPQQLQFKVLGKTTDSIQNGTRIHYKLKLHGIVPLKWETLILDWDPPHKFVDTQLSGPYHTWHHTHSFEPLGGGTLMTDRVKYQLNFGILGRLIQLIYVQWDVNKIFRHRFDVIQERFGTAKS